MTMKWRKIEPPDRRPGTINSKIHFLNGKTSVFFFHKCKHSLGKMAEMGVIEDLKWRQ